MSLVWEDYCLDWVHHAFWEEGANHSSKAELDALTQPSDVPCSWSAAVRKERIPMAELQNEISFGDKVYLCTSAQFCP